MPFTREVVSTVLPWSLAVTSHHHPSQGSDTLLLESHGTTHPPSCLPGPEMPQSSWTAPLTISTGPPQPVPLLRPPSATQRLGPRTRGRAQQVPRSEASSRAGNRPGVLRSAERWQLPQHTGPQNHRIGDTTPARPPNRTPGRTTVLTGPGSSQAGSALLSPAGTLLPPPGDPQAGPGTSWCTARCGHDLVPRGTRRTEPGTLPPHPKQASPLQGGRVP